MGDPDYSDSVPRKKAFIDLIKYFHVWEEFLEEEKPDLIFGGDNRFGNLVPYYISKQKNILYEIMYFSAVVPDSFIITRDKDGRMTELEEYWKKHQNKYLNQKELQTVEEYLCKFREKQDKPPMIDTRPTLNFDKIRYAFKMSRTALFVEGNDTPYLKPWRGIKSYLLRMLRAPLSKRYFESPQSGEKYFFFPLQVHLETTLLISNHQFFHQERLIELISKNLPAGYWLYVKGHPGYLGGHELSSFRSIKKLPNVRQINPLIPARNLIQDSVGVAVSVGTSGWEALMMGKPVLSFGINYYDASELTHKVNNLDQMDEVIRHIVNLPSVPSKAHEEKLSSFINAYFRTVYSGKIAFTGIYHANSSNRETVLDEKNLELVVNSIAVHLKKVRLLK
jgi:capsule polysaccharide modification protein KpsS